MNRAEGFQVSSAKVVPENGSTMPKKRLVVHAGCKATSGEAWFGVKAVYCTVLLLALLELGCFYLSSSGPV